MCGVTITLSIVSSGNRFDFSSSTLTVLYSSDENTPGFDGFAFGSGLPTARHSATRNAATHGCRRAHFAPLSQGDTTLKCKTLVVYYEDHARSATLKAAEPGPRGQQQISRLEARGGVTVNQKDQTATGSTGVFDMKTNTVTLSGNVIVTQGQNVLRGERLIVDLTNGVSRVEGGRVQGLFLPHSQQDQRQPGEKEPSRPALPSLLRSH